MRLSVYDAIRLLLVRIGADNEFPFSVKTPNATTRKAMAELEKGKGKRFAAADFTCVRRSIAPKRRPNDKFARQDGGRFVGGSEVQAIGSAQVRSKTGVHWTDSTRSAPAASIMRRSKPSAAPLASGISASAARKSSSNG